MTAALALASPIGTRAGDLSAWDKLQLGWLDYELVGAGQSRTLDLGPHEYNSAKARAAVVILPDKTVTNEYGAPFAGENMWWSDSGDDLENTMSRPVDLTAATTAALTLKARYEIEAGFDYLYVQASTDSGTTWTSLDGTAHPQPIFRIDGPPWRSRVQIYDAPFSLTRARSFTLHVNGRASLIRGQNAQPVFDDSRPYWVPEIPQTGVKVPDTGTRIRVASVDGTSMRIRVSSG